jgi:hypothetical protein
MNVVNDFFSKIRLYYLRHKKENISFYTILRNIQILSEGPIAAQSKGRAIQILHPWFKFLAIDQNYEPYESPILGQILDLISLAKINISEPRFESYDPCDMAN